MGFAVWMSTEEAWAQGTHEYRPMGCAVVARTAQFRAPDFSRYRHPPPLRSPYFVGLFGSLEEVNVFLRDAPTRAPDVRTSSIL